MIFEHFAINVNDPLTIANWYVKHIELTILRQQKEPPFTTFLGDKTGRVMCELYHRPDETIMDYKSQHPLTFHFAMETDDANSDKLRLLEAGASLTEEQHLPDGSHLVMLRDPFGISLQLCQRGERMNQITL